MKKIFMLATAAFLFSGVAFAQEKKADCCKKTAKTECKKECANKNCGDNCKKDANTSAKNGKSCCAKEAKADSKQKASTTTKS